MHRLSMVQALRLWSDLEAAYYGQHGYGSDTAEIYMFRLMSSNPSAESARREKAPTGLLLESYQEQVREANESLYALLTHFAKVKDVRIEVYDRELGDWLKSEMHDHRVHVKVIRRA